MQDLVEKGHLYIAQPPLFRLKKGRSERYIKSEVDLDDYLLEHGVEQCELLTMEDGQSRPVRGEHLRNVVKRLLDERKLLDRMALRYDSRVIDLAVRSPGLTEEMLRDRVELAGWLEDLPRRIELCHPELRGCRMLIEPDEEETWRVRVQTRLDGALRETLLGMTLIRSGEFRRLRTSQRQLAESGVGFGPWQLVLGGEREVLRDLRQVVERVLSAGRKGQQIQRYKGLGEMNPEQLWETTMCPDNRTLLQVRADEEIKADEIFSILMGDDVERRRSFIERHALEVRNLDI
ncbi:MAG: hypothetical protein FJ125_00095 [Deltaproteobacteria bacterium]|nr:hypothetical protein [Deltaproteobacteria bacterium]